MEELQYKVLLEARDAHILACEKRIVELEAERDELEAMLRHELLCHDSFLTDTEVDEEIADLRDRCRVERDALPASQTRYNEDIAALLREHLKRLSEWVQDYVGLYDYLETECNGVKAVLKLRAYPDHVTSRLAVTSLTASKQKKTR